jgi:hypothetical protein
VIKVRKTWWFLARAVAMLILVGLLVAGGFAIHTISWSQGYATGQQAAEGAEVVEPLPYLYYGGHPTMLWGIARPLMCIGGFLLILFVVSGFFRALTWHRMSTCGPWATWHHWGPHPRQAARWAKHWRRHGPIPPWCWDWDEDEETEKADKEPDAGSDSKE